MGARVHIVMFIVELPSICRPLRTNMAHCRVSKHDQRTSIPRWRVLVLPEPAAGLSCAVPHQDDFPINGRETACTGLYAYLRYLVGSHHTWTYISKLRKGAEICMMYEIAFGVRNEDSVRPSQIHSILPRTSVIVPQTADR